MDIQNLTSFVFFFSRCSTLVSQTLLVYDYLCTLDQEIELVWSKNFSIGSILFFINRYLPFLDTIILNVIFDVQDFSYSSNQCRRYVQLTAWLMFVGMVVSEVILTIRTAAMWTRKPVVDILFVLWGIMCIVPAAVFMHLEMNSLEFGPPQMNLACIIVKSDNTLFIVYSLLALSEVVIAIFTGIKAYQHLQRTQSPWVSQLYREGLLFYAYMLGFSITNACMDVIMPELGTPLQTLQRVLHSILCNRVLFAIFRGPSMTTMTVTGNPTFTSVSDDNRLEVQLTSTRRFSLSLPTTTTTLSLG